MAFGTRNIGKNNAIFMKVVFLKKNTSFCNDITFSMHIAIITEYFTCKYTDIKGLSKIEKKLIYFN